MFSRKTTIIMHKLKLTFFQNTNMCTKLFMNCNKNFLIILCCTICWLTLSLLVATGYTCTRAPSADQAQSAHHYRLITICSQYIFRIFPLKWVMVLSRLEDGQVHFKYLAGLKVYSVPHKSLTVKCIVFCCCFFVFS
jgi:hypothetical protein